MELNGLEAQDELQINTVTQQATQQNSEKLKPTCHYGKNLVTVETGAVNSNEKKTQPKITKITRLVLTATTKIVMAKQILTPTMKFPRIPTQTIEMRKNTEDLDLSILTVKPVVKVTTPQNNVSLEQTQRTDRLPEVDDRKDKTKSNRKMLKATQMEMLMLQPQL